MRTIVFIILCFLIASFNCFTQKTAFFETTFYFEDAVGNRDSIIIGYDPEANYEYNPDFGEEDILTPFDSIFEVRAANSNRFFWRNNDIVLSKKIISNMPGLFFEAYNCYRGSFAIFFLVQTQYPPVTISWNRHDFTNYCNAWSFMTPHYTPLQDHEWYLGPYLGEEVPWACMAVDSTLISELNYEFSSEPVYRIEPIEGIGSDTIYGLMLLRSQFGNFGPECTKGFTVSQHEVVQDESTLEVFPNPSSDIINIRTPSQKGDINYLQCTGRKTD